MDLEREDLLRVAGISSQDADDVLSLIETLTVEEGAADEPTSAAAEKELAEVRELAADILGLPLPEFDEPSEAAARKSPGPDGRQSG
jgi:hypothetical protein